MANKLGMPDNEYRALIGRSIRNMEINVAIGLREQAEEGVRRASGTTKGMWGAAMGILADAKRHEEEVLAKWRGYK